MAKKNEWRKRQGVVYSTDENFTFSSGEGNEVATLAPKEQNLKVSLDKSGRAGKQVTLVSGFVGSAHDLDLLGKLLKSRCGVGGSVKEGNILIQGDLREKVVEILLREGYRAKRSG